MPLRLLLVEDSEDDALLLLRELRKRGYDGGYTILTDWLRPQREAAAAAGNIRPEVVT